MAPTLLAVSLKMYLGHQATLDWCWSVREMHAGLSDEQRERVQLAVLPTHLSIPDVARILHGTGIQWGAQDLAWEDRGAFTGEVSPVDLADLDCTFAETGHAERRALFGETDEVVARKNAAALRNGLTPILCVGEPTRGAGTVDEQVAQAVADCRAQLTHTLPETTDDRAAIVVAYEPVWAIGAAEPAPDEHIRRVCTELGDWLRGYLPNASIRVIYGGSAGPGLITRLGDGCDGLFLGRFAHDVADLHRIVDEAAALS